MLPYMPGKLRLHGNNVIAPKIHAWNVRAVLILSIFVMHMSSLLKSVGQSMTLLSVA